MQTGLEEHPDLLGERRGAQGRDGFDEQAFEGGAVANTPAHDLLLIAEKLEMVARKLLFAVVLNDGKEERRVFAADADALNAGEIATRDVQLESVDKLLFLGGGELLDGAVERV